MAKQKINLVWKDVESSMIEFIHYSTDGNASYLGIRFTNEYCYIFNSVPLNDVFRMVLDKSPGSYFSKNIRNKFPYKHLGVISEESPLQVIGIELDGRWNNF